MLKEPSISTFENIDAVRLLKERMEFLARGNPAFSLRAFSKEVKIAPGSLSEILNRKRPLTLKTAVRIAKHLFTDPQDRNRFLDVLPGKTQGPKDEFSPISQDLLKIVSDPVHFYLLELMRTDHFHSDIRWMARRLKKTVIEMRLVIDRLKAVKLIKQQGAKLVRTDCQITTSHDVFSPSLRASHKASLRESIDCLDTIPLELRDISSITMPIDPARIPEAKKYLKEFRRRFAKTMETGKKREVYNLNLQFVPVTSLEDSHV